jgi:RimJ/RimL family protein N-acetyltransferase
MGIQLRDYRSTDLHRLVELANNAKVSRDLRNTFPSPYSLADAEWWLEVGSKAEGTLTQVIEFNGEFVGSVGIIAQSGWILKQEVYKQGQYFDLYHYAKYQSCG